MKAVYKELLLWFDCLFTQTLTKGRKYQKGEYGKWLFKSVVF